MPSEANTIDLYTASVSRDYLEDLKSPDKLLQHHLEITKTSFAVTPDGEQFADLMRVVIDTCDKIDVLKELVEPMREDRRPGKQQKKKQRRLASASSALSATAVPAV